MKILGDIRVLDLTHVMFGPWCTLMLAELGAEVIKIEPPWGALDRLPEEGRLFGGVAPTFHHFNLNKKDLALNLRDERGIKIFKELLKMSDVVVQNFSPGTMEKMGLGYEELKKIRPNIIYAALSGFGQTGPYANRPSYAPIAESITGYTRWTGDNANPDGPPLRAAGQYGDLAPGTMAAMSIIAALFHRYRTGQGQMIDVAQIDCMVAYNTNITTYFLSGQNENERRLEMEDLRRKRGQDIRGFTGIFKAKDGYVYMMGLRAKGMDALKHQFGEELSRDTLEKFIEDKTKEEAEKFFMDLDIPVAQILYSSEAVTHPQVVARNLFVEVEHAKMGKIKAINFPVKFSETPGEVTSASPLLGQHNKEILMKYLGYT
ncbi:MAG: CoA transferase, partial [Candidatus Bathyarchaeota archaeon]